MGYVNAVGRTGKNDPRAFDKRLPGHLRYEDHPPGWFSVFTRGERIRIGPIGEAQISRHKKPLGLVAQVYTEVPEGGYPRPWSSSSDKFPGEDDWRRIILKRTCKYRKLA